MKTLFTFLIFCLPLCLLAQAPPVVRTSLTTNNAAKPTDPGQSPVWDGTSWIMVDTNSFGGGGGVVSELWTNNAGNLQPVSNVWTVSVPRTLTISNSATLWGLSSNRLGIFGPEPFVAKRNSGQTTVLGHNALTNDAVTGDHTAIGFQSLALLTNGGFLVSVGDDAMGVLLQGRQNTAVGSQALFAQQFGTNVTALGYQALASLVVSNNNTAVGSRALLNNRAEDNTGVGFNAGELLVTGRKNSFLGARANVFFDDCASNVVAGVDSFASFQSVILGNDITPGDPSTQLTLVGNSTRAGSHNNSFAIGYRARVTADNQGILGSNVTQYVMRNVAYNFPSAQATTISALRNDGAGNLDWGTNFAFLGATNFNFGGQSITNIDQNWTNDTVVLRTSETNTSPPLRVGMAVGAAGPLGIPPDQYWLVTNVGIGSVGLGSNQLVRGHWSSILGGAFNSIQTNGDYSTIVGGTNNIVTNRHAVIVGGFSNTNGALGGFIGGGASNSISSAGNTAHAWNVIAGGLRNRISPSSWSTIAGGQNNTIIPDGASIGGGFDNDILTLGTYGVIAGGGQNSVDNNSGAVVGGQGNTVSGSTGFGFIGGGSNNDVNRDYAVITGGSQNLNNADYGFVGGGFQNALRGDNAGSEYSVIVGGQANNLGTHPTGEATHAFIGGGNANDIQMNDTAAVIVGGAGNGISQDNTHAFIGGGLENGVGEALSGSGDYSVIVGGIRNLIYDKGTNAFIGGGRTNWIATGGHNSSIVGGLNNFLTNQHGFIGGGERNTNHAAHGFVGGGLKNFLNTSGDFGVIVGGASNQVNAAHAWVLGSSGTNFQAFSIVLAPNGSNSQSHFTASNTLFRTSVATVPDAIVDLTADNQVVDATLRSYVRLSSNDTTASNRDFVLTGTNVVQGAELVLEWTDATDRGQLVDDSACSGAGNHRLNTAAGNWTPDQNDTLTLKFNGTDWLEITRSTN